MAIVYDIIGSRLIKGRGQKVVLRFKEELLYLMVKVRCPYACKAGGSNFHVVRPNIVSVLCWVVACISTLRLGGSGGMLPQENFEIYSLRDGFW